MILALCSLYQNVMLIMCASFNGVFCIYLSLLLHVYFVS